MDKENIIDVDFINTGTSEPSYYSTEEVSKILDEEVKTINYWCVKLDSILNINLVGRERIFNDTDLNNLKQIKRLIREEKMDTDQVKQYLSEPETKIIKRNENQIPMTMISTIANVIATQISNSIAEANKEIAATIKTQSKYIKQLEKKVDVLSKQQETIASKLDSMEQQATTRDTEILDHLHRKLEEREQQFQLQQQSQTKKSFFRRLFNTK